MAEMTRSSRARLSGRDRAGRRYLYVRRSGCWQRVRRVSWRSLVDWAVERVGRSSF